MSASSQPDRPAFDRESVPAAIGSKATSRWLGSATGFQATSRFLRRELWVWPLIVAVLFGGTGWLVHRRVENAMRDQRATDLNTMADASVTALMIWMKEQREKLRLFAEDEALQPLVAELLGTAAAASADLERSLTRAPAQETLRSRLTGRARRSGFFGYFIVSPDSVVLAADQDAPIGKLLTGYRKEIVDLALSGRTEVSRPFRSPLLLADSHGELRSNLPTMFVAGPIRNSEGMAVAVLGLRIRPEDQFTRILQVARFGQSGETYAFDRNGLMLSQSRFDDELKQIGLLVDQPDARSILTLEIRDPLANLSLGERPRKRRSELPLTHSVASAIEGKDGHDADGYRDYRGVPCVSAWRWLPEHELGVVTEVDVAEAFQPVYILRSAFRLLMTLLALSAIAIFLAMLLIARQQRELQRATVVARQLGQYALEEQLGAGGMGTVYRARHAMLRRPTAVKLLDIDRISPAAVARFEREVQLTSALTHPNTVAVYDYGRTPDGIFYYAMELLEGMTLDELVRRFGPLPEARVVHLLRQVCGSLAEAHAAGLVHRDIKPANIFLTCRGGMHDFVKVLDFGLAKALAGDDQAHLTSPNAVTGTPLYLSPEAVDHPDRLDARSDVYGLGAVGYYLLTATPVFTGATVVEICLKHVNALPEPPSIRAGRPIAPALEALLLRCLAKNPDDRPRDAAELQRQLELCPIPGRWTAHDAAEWWTVHATAARTATALPPQSLQAFNPETTVAFDDSAVERG